MSQHDKDRETFFASLALFDRDERELRVGRGPLGADDEPRPAGRQRRQGPRTQHARHRGRHRPVARPLQVQPVGQRASAAVGWPTHCDRAAAPRELRQARERRAAGWPSDRPG